MRVHGQFLLHCTKNAFNFLLEGMKAEKRPENEGG
jgi:hypothetical protein